MNFDIIVLDQEEPEWDNHNGSEWVIGIDIDHNVFVIKAPNIQPGFFDDGKSAEDIGLPVDLPEQEPGVYKIECSFYESHDYESDIIDEWGFKIEKIEQICILNSQ